LDTTEKDVLEVTLNVQGKPVIFNLDTGAEVTALSELVWNYLDLNVPLQTAEICLFGPDHCPLQVLGVTTLLHSHKNNSCTQPIYIIKELKSKVLLGLPAIKELKLLLNMCTVEKSITSHYPSLFTGLGTFARDYTIKLKPNHPPITLCAPRNIPIPLRTKVQTELERMQSLGVISPVHEPTPWCAAMVVFPKDEGAVRICVDLKELNKCV